MVQKDAFNKITFSIRWYKKTHLTKLPFQVQYIYGSKHKLETLKLHKQLISVQCQNM